MELPWAKLLFMRSSSLKQWATGIAVMIAVALVSAILSAQERAIQVSIQRMYVGGEVALRQGQQVQNTDRAFLNLPLHVELQNAEAENFSLTRGIVDRHGFPL